MRALRFDGSLHFDPDYPKPTPAKGECLVKVHLAGVCATDIEITRGYMGYQGVLGHEMVGTVEAGPDEWLGKRVACEINCVCGKCSLCHAGLSNHCSDRTVMGIAGRDGCFADYVVVPVRNLHAIADNISDEEAVFVEPLAAAWQVVRQVPIEPRMNVAIVGSGRLGLLVAQVLNTIGCKLEVVGRNPDTLLLCEKKHIQTRHVDDFTPRHDRDVVVECTGAAAGLELALGMVRPRGTVVLKSTYSGDDGPQLAPAVVDEITIIGSRCGPFPDAINCLARRQVDVLSMISRSFPLERGVEAMKAAEEKGNVKVLLKINPR